MANLYTSAKLAPASNPVELLIPRVSMSAQLKLEVEKFSAADESLGLIVPPTSYVENGGCAENETRIRVFLEEGQVAEGEKVQVRLND